LEQWVGPNSGHVFGQCFSLIRNGAELKAAGIDTKLILNSGVNTCLIGDSHSAVGVRHYENAIHPK
jgi:hypothetical protein